MALVFAVAGCSHRPYVEPEDFSDRLTDEQVAENFLKIAFGNEFGDDAPQHHKIFKWRGPINVVLLDVITRREREQVGTHLSRISEITGLSFRYTGYQRSADLAVRVSSTEQIVEDLRGFRNDPRMSEKGAKSIEQVEKLLTRAEFWGRTDQQCIFFVGRFHPRWKGYVAIRSGLSEQAFWSCVVEELTQVFGLPNDDDSVEPSIFNDDERYHNLTRHDVWLLKLLYDPTVKPGMTRREVKEVIMERIAFYRSQTEVQAQ